MIGFIFARESNRYDKTVYSLKSQVEACQAAAEQDGVTIEKIFREQFSGRDLRKMPRLAELRRLIERTPGPKRVYVYSQDRLVRGKSAADIFYLLVEFREAGAELRIVKDPLDLDSIGGQLTALIRGHEASEEIGRILDRTMRGKLQRIREGKIPNSGREKFGYRRDKASGRASVNGEQAAVVRKIAAWILAGESINECARRLNAAAIPSPFAKEGHSGKWHTKVITRMISDPAYKGEGRAHRLMHSDKGMVARPEAEQIPLPGCYPAILSPADWQRIQDRIAANRGAWTRNRKHQALLRGLIFCAVCGKPMYFISSPPTPSYRCSSVELRRYDKSAPKCKGKQRIASLLEAEVWRDVSVVLSDAAKLQAALNLEAEADAPAVELARLDREIARREQQISNLLRELRDASAIVAAGIKREIESVESERLALIERQRDESRLAAEAEQRRAQIADVQELIEAIRPRLSSLGFGEKRAILESLGVTVRVDGKEFEIAWRA